MQLSLYIIMECISKTEVFRKSNNTIEGIQWNYQRQWYSLVRRKITVVSTWCFCYLLLVSFPSFLHSYLCTIPTYVQYLPMSNTYLCAIPTYVQYLPMCNTYLCAIPTYVQYLPMCNTYLCATPTLAAKTSLIDFQLDSLVIIIANSNEMGEDFNVFLGETTTDCSR